jgi:hypothetical protein
VATVTVTATVTITITITITIYHRDPRNFLQNDLLCERRGCSVESFDPMHP